MGIDIPRKHYIVIVLIQLLTEPIIKKMLFKLTSNSIVIAVAVEGIAGSPDHF